VWTTYIAALRLLSVRGNLRAMSLPTLALKKLAEFGLSMEQILEVSALTDEPKDLAAEKRRAYDRQRKASTAKRNSTGNSTGKQPDHSTGIPCGIPPETRPLAHVRDITSTSENNLSSVVVVLPRTEIPHDDWPKGDLLRLLVEAADSPRLDPQKSDRLVLSAGRITAWRRDGASWLHDVLPTVTAISRQRGQPIGTWTYFDKAIAQSIADNRRALTIPEATRHELSPPSRQTPRQDRLGRMLGGLVAAANERTSDVE
jgi:hypothetical protein